MDSQSRAALSLETSAPPAGVEEVTDQLLQHVMPYATGNTHPRFFGWVHGSGLADGLLAEMVAATMNSNCGGRDHGAVYVEREVLDWSRRAFGFPDTASGVLVTGTSQATLLALACARQAALGDSSRKTGTREARPLTAYAAEGVHHAIPKALELLGLGSDALHRVPRSVGGGIDTAALAARVESDRASGDLPFCVIGTAGSVDRGEVDDLRALAGLCRRERLWFHVDGAFGAWLGITAPPWRDRVAGLEAADSIAFDFHKWMFVQYAVGALLVRDGTAHRATFASRPAYLAAGGSALGGGDPWFCDFGIDLSRGFSALKVWTALRLHGGGALARAIERCCELAARLPAMIDERPALRLAAPVHTCVCCFSAAPDRLDGDAQDALNRAVAARLQRSGEAVFSTTDIDGRQVLRAAITNHRTTDADLRRALDGAVDAAKALV